MPSTSKPLGNITIPTEWLAPDKLLTRAELAEVTKEVTGLGASRKGTAQGRAGRWGRWDPVYYRENRPCVLRKPPHRKKERGRPPHEEWPRSSRSRFSDGLRSREPVALSR
jgi:hypothetical protein